MDSPTPPQGLCQYSAKISCCPDKISPNRDAALQRGLPATILAPLASDAVFSGIFSLSPILNSAVFTDQPSFTLATEQSCQSLFTITKQRCQIFTSFMSLKKKVLNRLYKTRKQSCIKAKEFRLMLSLWPVPAGRWKVSHTCSSGGNDKMHAVLSLVQQGRYIHIYCSAITASSEKNIATLEQLCAKVSVHSTALRIQVSPSSRNSQGEE